MVILYAWGSTVSSPSSRFVHEFPFTGISLIASCDKTIIVSFHRSGEQGFTPGIFQAGNYSKKKGKSVVFSVQDYRSSADPDGRDDANQADR